MQFGSHIRNEDCQIYRGGLDDGTIMSTIVLQYTTNNGITWHTLREHWPGQYSVPRRVSQPLPTLVNRTESPIYIAGANYILYCCRPRREQPYSGGGSPLTMVKDMINGPLIMSILACKYILGTISNN